MFAGKLCRAFLGYAGVAGALFLPLIPTAGQKFPATAPGTAASALGSVSQIVPKITTPDIAQSAPLLPFVAKPEAFRKWNVISINGRDYVPLQDVASFYEFTRLSVTAQAISLSSADRILQCAADAYHIFINNLRFALAAPIVKWNGTFLISRRDLANTIDPVLRPWRINGSPVRTVVLDAGHGGNDNGTWSSLGSEKIFTLDVINRTAVLLQRHGYSVAFTRSSDVYVPLAERVRLANQNPDAVFISVHFNAGPARGIETYCLAPQGVPSTDNRPAITDVLFNPGNALDAQNVALATAVHGSVLKRLKSPDRGVRRARFHVLRDILIPAVLVEGGYLSGGDARSIASPLYREALAQGITEAVRRYALAVPGEQRPVLTELAKNTVPSVSPSSADSKEQTP
ncbi:MAG TPA: N-acetylmuramoyl-L-alanine amidase [Chthoniobacterales bacterium]